MRTMNLRPNVWVTISALFVSGCSYPHPGPSLPEDGNPLPSTPSVINANSVVSPAATPVTFSPPQKPVPLVTPAPPKVKAEIQPPPVPVQPVEAAPATSQDNTSSFPAPQLATGPDAGMPLPGSTDSDKVSGDSDSGSSFDNLDLIDASLKGKLAILRVGSQPTTNNLLGVFAGLKNKTEQSLKIEVQTIYKDKSGNSLNGGSWITMTLKPHQETEYRSAAITEDAVDFLVRIRRAQEPGTDTPPGDAK